MTPMPPEIIKTITAYRQIICKLRLLLQRQGVKLPPIAALSLASLPAERITVREAKRLRMLLGSNPYNTVEALHEAGLVRCPGDIGQALSVEVTPAGRKLAKDVRAVLGGREAGESVETAE